MKNANHKKSSDLKFYRDNLNLMKLICRVGIEHSPACKKFRDYFQLPTELLSHLHPWKWQDGILQYSEVFTDDEKKLLGDNFMETIRAMTPVMDIEFKLLLKEKINVPKNYESHIWDYLAYGVITAPATNFSFTFHKIDGKKTIEQSAEGGVDYISLNIFKRLSTEEKQKLFKFLDRFSKIAFPSYIQDKKALKNIERDTKLFEASFGRSRSTTRKEYTGYLSHIKKAFDRGEYSKSFFHEAVLKNKEDIEIIHSKGVTTNHIAKNFSKTNKIKISGNNLKVVNSRLKKTARLFVNDIPKN